MLVLLCAGPRRGRGRGARRRPRSSWSTWRRWSTTTSSTPRRCAAACRRSPRPPAASARVGHRRPALLPRLRPARRRPATPRAVELLADASVALARGELAQRQDAFDTAISERALPRALPAEDRDAVRVRLPARPRRPRRCGDFGAEIGLAFQLLDDVLDVTGPPERTGKARGTDLLDGTVTLPLIVAAEADPAIARRRPARPRRRRAPRRSATGSPRPARSSRSAPGPWRWSPTAKRRLDARRLRRRAAPACSTWSPTASSSATAEPAQRKSSAVIRSASSAAAKASAMCCMFSRSSCLRTPLSAWVPASSSSS